MKTIEVVAGIIKYGSEILCVQRPNNKHKYISNKFEFPGGKIEQGESNKEALRRELFEELKITPEINDLYLTVNHNYPDFKLIMHTYICLVDSKELNLTEHISSVWLQNKDLKQLDWAAADIPIVEKLIKYG